MDSTVTYKCPNCDAGLIFDPEKGKFVCEFCISDFTDDDLRERGAFDRTEESDREQAEFSEHIKEYCCPSCGAEVITDENTVAGTCFYCHNPIVLSDKVSGNLKPSKIIPFAFDKEEAKARFLRFAKKKKFVPKSYAAPENAENISGVYYPFWVTDADAEADFDARGTKVRTWRMGNYRYTETSHYNIMRSGDIHFEDITTSAISEEDKAMLEGIFKEIEDEEAVATAKTVEKSESDEPLELEIVINGLTGYKAKVTRYLCDSKINNCVTGEPCDEYHPTFEEWMRVDGTGALTMKFTIGARAFIFIRVDR